MVGIGHNDTSSNLYGRGGTGVCPGLRPKGQRSPSSGGAGTRSTRTERSEYGQVDRQKRMRGTLVPWTSLALPSEVTVFCSHGSSLALTPAKARQKVAGARLCPGRVPFYPLRFPCFVLTAVRLRSRVRRRFPCSFYQNFKI